ncbi:SDR family oxidoreductase [Pseudaminobacter sp. NGMCC 1.201702]|uniref:SDR family oxidoreductase n=1 Tax=Pseudaminobacter sp. NGMCC 1.201702 TaxID=3391825 RepID=UPI0039F06868
MRIFLTGASGLIGSSLSARLALEGHEVIPVVRPGTSTASPSRSVVSVDMAKAHRVEDWVGHLQGVDAVVNCAGVLQDSGRENTQEVHATAAAALFLACEQAGVRRVIHFSAIGVDREQPSPFSATKLAGDEALMRRDLDWVILRPSVVLGRPAFGASALFRGLAALPILPSMPNTGRLQVVQLEDVVSTAAFFLEPNRPSRLVLELAGLESLTMNEVVGQYRSWFGWRTARKFMLPRWAASLVYRLGDYASTLGWRPPTRTNAAKEITRGAVGNPDPWIATTGIQPMRLATALTANPATIQEKWFARLYFIKPLIFLLLPFFWVMTGVISLTTGWHSGVDLLINTIAGPMAAPAVVAGALADIVIGTLIAWRKTTWWGLWGAIALSLFYAIAGTTLRPDLWNEPLGPLLKILPILALHLVALAILEER